VQFAARRFCFSGERELERYKVRQTQRAFWTEKPAVLDEVGNLMEVLPMGRTSETTPARQRPIAANRTLSLAADVFASRRNLVKA